MNIRPFARMRETASQISDRVIETGERVVETFSNTFIALTTIAVFTAIALVIAVAAYRR